MTPLGNPSLELVLGATGDGRILQTAPPSNVYAAYLNLPPARYPLRVCRVGDRQNPLKSLDVPLRANAYFTVLVRLQPDGQPAVELIDDTPDPKTPPTNRLTVRQFCRDARVVITAAGRESTAPLGFGEAQTLVGLPDGIVPLAMRATAASGIKTWNAEANFRGARHATILVVSDPYDRIRPRVSSDGPSPEAEAAAAAEATADPTPTP